ncbi:MAG: glycoside hydrolase family 13 protein, partial [Firmicutes bacterium]|nr:glycoside hydrolase family 13 protein [Bacillota bacterium]
MRIYHDSHKSEYREPFGAVTGGERVKLSLIVTYDENDSPEETGNFVDPGIATGAVNLRLWRDETGERMVPMEQVSCEHGKALYSATIEAPEESGLLWYYFTWEQDGKKIFYGNNYDQTGGEGVMSESEPPSYQITVYNYAPVPTWYKEGIVYQIFPDRFARDGLWESRCEDVLKDRESAGLKGQGKFIEEDWYRPAYYIKDEEGNVTDWPFYGGSFKGIEERLDHLTSLGVSAIYLNPIFEASSNHRYDTGDYMKVDPMLGTEEDFRELAEAARKKGIRLILDGVFSHTGADSVYFDKYGNYGGEGAYDNPESRYRDWYEFRDNDPVGYRSWWGVRDLPEVNETNESYRDMICGDSGVLSKWLRAGASGWRLDVADELPDSFIREIRHRIKVEDVDGLLLGEVWEDASNKISYGEKRKYLMGDELDSTMNYPLRDLLTDFADYRITASQVARRIMSLAENYPRENFYGALNLIGSHDRQRILTRMGAGENYDRAVARVKLLSVLQYTLPGVPCIYYGDEAGMTGGEDPDNRNGYPWECENQELLFHYRQLGILYREHPALQTGGLRMLNSGNENVIAFLRTGEEENLLILANRCEGAETIYADFLSDQMEDVKTSYCLELLRSEEIKTESGSITGDIKVDGNGTAIICMRRENPKSFEMKRSAGVICHISS